jgi:hypothetical protein
MIFINQEIFPLKGSRLSRCVVRQQLFQGNPDVKLALMQPPCEVSWIWRFRATAERCKSRE